MDFDDQKVPQDVIREWTGLQSVQLQRISKSWGIPLSGRWISIPDVLRSVTEFFTTHGQRLAGFGIAAGSEPGSGALERLREERCLRERIRRLREQDQLVAAPIVAERLAAIADIWRNVGRQIEKECDEHAAELFREGLAEAIGLCEELAGAAANETAK